MKLILILITFLLLFPSSFVLACEGEGHSPEEHANHNEYSAQGDHGHGREVIKETPPNYKVLSAFGAINFSFLVVGLWNKRVRKKVELDVYAGKKA